MKERQKMEVYGEVVPMWQFRILMAITPFYISFSFLQRHLADKMQMCEGHMHYEQSVESLVCSHCACMISITLLQYIQMLHKVYLTWCSVNIAVPN